MNLSKELGKINTKYTPGLLDYFTDKSNIGKFPKGQNIGTGLIGAPACGDVLKIQIKVDDKGIIEDAKFQTFGCGSAIASSSLATEWVKGKTLDESLKLTNKYIADKLKLPPIKLHCSMLAEEAIKSAINDFKQKQRKSN